MSSTAQFVYSPSLPNKTVFLPQASPIHGLALPLTQLRKRRCRASSGIPSPPHTYHSILRCCLQDVTERLTTTQQLPFCQPVMYIRIYVPVLLSCRRALNVWQPLAAHQVMAPATSLISSSTISPSVPSVPGDG